MDANTPIETDDTDETGAVNETAFRMVSVRDLTPMQFAQLGLKQVAYVKPVIFNGSQGFAIHAADGSPMAVAPQLETAIGAILQHDMAAALVH
jgi:hypothetical protein